MEDIKPGMFFISADGDGVGKLVGRSVLANDVEELHKVSNRIDAAQDFILHWCQQVDGVKISGGGDEFTAAIPKEALKKLEALRKSVEKSFGYTLSVGVGKSLSEGGTALLVAKLRGKDRVVYFNSKIKEDIKKAKRRVREGRASQEEYKLSEAYLEKSENMGKTCELHKSRELPEKGVHQSLASTAAPGSENSKNKELQGMSSMGYNVRNPRPGMVDPKVKASQKLAEQRKMPKPKLGKSCDLHKGMEGSTKNFPQSKPSGSGEGQKGVHHEYDQRGESMAGIRGVGTNANKLDPNTIPMNERKDMHRKVLAEMKGMPKPNLGKSEEESLKDIPEDTVTDDKCPYCQPEETETDDCQYCQDLDAVENADGTAGMDNCPACQDYDSEKQTTGGIDTDDCPYCDNESLEQANPEQDQAVAADDANPSTNGPDDCPECQKMYGDAVENEPGQTGQEDPNLQGHETAEEVLDLLDQEPGSGGETPAQEAQKIDNTELPQGDAMEEGTSVPEDFGDAQKNDISDSEAAFGQSGQESGQDEPDMTGVLQSGLDDHANDQKKQQVLDMVAQTLQGFKANKQSLEATKEQNQPLYNSCIQMLKSMIELCKLLGLQPQMPTTPDMPGADSSGAPQEAPPASPVQAAPSEGAAQDPKTQAG